MMTMSPTALLSQDEILPPELMVEIFSMLPVKQLCALRLVCSAWADLIACDVVWRRLLAWHFGATQFSAEELLLAEQKGWMAVYQSYCRLSWNKSSLPSDVRLSADKKTVENVASGQMRLSAAVDFLLTKEGDYFFEFLADHIKTPGFPNLTGFGISIESTGGWYETNKGVGWYNRAGAFRYGQGIKLNSDPTAFSEARTGEEWPSWEEGDVLAISVHLKNVDDSDSPHRQDSFVRFYRNKELIGSINIDPDDRYKVTFLFHQGDRITLRSGGKRTPPSDYCLSS
ncbi:hypothetical protein QOT17_003202 [Balamuthia mandrillaris]